MEFTREDITGLDPGGIYSIGSYKEILFFEKVNESNVEIIEAQLINSFAMHLEKKKSCFS